MKSKVRRVRHGLIRSVHYRCIINERFQWAAESISNVPSESRASILSLSLSTKTITVIVERTIIIKSMVKVFE